MKIKDYGELKFLKSLDDYRKELIILHNEMRVPIVTGILISDDLDLVRRCEELIVIIEFLEGNLKEVNKWNQKIIVNIL